MRNEKGRKRELYKIQQNPCIQLPYPPIADRSHNVRSNEDTLTPYFLYIIP